MFEPRAAHIEIKPNLVTDSGIENVNGDVDALIEAGLITRILALVEVTYSNSIIEAYWRSLKHEWLNSVMPHSAFRGQTPDEIYLGTGVWPMISPRLGHELVERDSPRIARCRTRRVSPKAV